MSPVAATYLYVPGFILFWGLLAVALVLFAHRMYLLFLPLRLAKEEKRFDHLRRRIRLVSSDVLLQRCNLKSVSRKDMAGVGHALLFWGFGLFFLSYLVFIGLGEGLGLFSVISDGFFQVAFHSILDVVGLCVVASVVWAATRRYVFKPKRLKSSREAGVVLALVFILMALNFLVEGTGYSAHNLPVVLPPIGAALASLLRSLGIYGQTAENAYRVIWWIHYVAILGFLVYIPRSKHLHVIASPLNVFFKPLDRKWANNAVDLENTESLGVSRIQDFSWKQLLDLYACAECGRCTENCPAQPVSALSPRDVTLKLKEHLIKVANSGCGARVKSPRVGPNTVLAGGVVKTEEIWACTTCGACQEVCPTGIEHVNKVLDLRRNLVFEGDLDPGHERAFHRILDDLNPWGIPWNSRSQWALGLDVEESQEGEHYDFLYWVGCTASSDPRAGEVARALFTILKQVGLRVAILGNGEMCCGDLARRVGEEGLFQSLAAANIRAIASVGAPAILTHCPHCFHVLKDEYSQLGARFSVLHHAQVLNELLRHGKIAMRPLNQPVVYHDPCYLGRYQGIFDEPRLILKSAAGAKVLEMQRARGRSFCCGGGGGSMWKENVKNSELIAADRIQQAVQTGAQVLATACPFCLNMLGSSSQTSDGSNLEVKDIVELVDLNSGKN